MNYPVLEPHTRDQQIIIKFLKIWEAIISIAFAEEGLKKHFTNV